MDEFEPLVRNPHLQTIVGHYWRRAQGLDRYPVEQRLYRTEPDVQVLVETQRPPGEAVGEVVMVHGLEGSGQTGYMRGLSLAALEAGFGAHRFHMRTCGGTEHLCRTLYHAGLTSDLLSVLRQLHEEGRAPAFVVGFSLGGNVVLKLAGELGENAWPLLRGVCAVSTPLDLAACARRVDQPDNRIYQRRFVKKMRARLCATGRYHTPDFAGLRTVREIDDRVTAPSFGFGNAENYYRTESSLRFLSGIRVPVLLIQAKDDPMVPFDTFESEAVRANPWIELLATGHGGHLGFLARRPPHCWAEGTIMEWILQQNVKKQPFVTSQS